MIRTTEDRPKLAINICAILLLVLSIGYCDEQKTSREQGQFAIYGGGKEIGREKFSNSKLR